MPCSDDTESIAREKILMRAKTCALAAELQKMVEHVPAVEEWRRIGAYCEAKRPSLRSKTAAFRF